MIVILRGHTWGRSPSPCSAGRVALSVRHASAPSLFPLPLLFPSRWGWWELRDWLPKNSWAFYSKNRIWEGWFGQTPSWVQHLFSLFILLKAFSKILWTMRCHLGTPLPRQHQKVSLKIALGFFSPIGLVLTRNSFLKEFFSLTDRWCYAPLYLF